jgi:hypothetical protein
MAEARMLEEARKARATAISAATKFEPKFDEKGPTTFSQWATILASVLGGIPADILLATLDNNAFEYHENTLAKIEGNKDLADILLITMAPHSRAQRIASQQKLANVKGITLFKRLLASFDPTASGVNRKQAIQENFQTLKPAGTNTDLDAYTFLLEFRDLYGDLEEWQRPSDAVCLERLRVQLPQATTLISLKETVTENCDLRSMLKFLLDKLRPRTPNMEGVKTEAVVGDLTAFISRTSIHASDNTSNLPEHRTNDKREQVCFFCSKQSHGTSSCHKLKQAAEAHADTERGNQQQRGRTNKPRYTKQLHAGQDRNRGTRRAYTPHAGSSSGRSGSGSDSDFSARSQSPAHRATTQRAPSTYAACFSGTQRKFRKP